MRQIELVGHNITIEYDENAPGYTSENALGLFNQIDPTNIYPFSSIDLTPEVLISIKFILHYRHSGRRKTSSPKLDNKIIKKFIKLKYDKRY